MLVDATEKLPILQINLSRDLSQIPQQRNSRRHFNQRPRGNIGIGPDRLYIRLTFSSTSQH